MRIKNICLKMFSIVLIALMITGCKTKSEHVYGGVSKISGITNVSRDNKYKQWADAVGLLDRENYKVIYMEETNGSFYVQFAEIEYDNAYEGMKDIKSLIEAHNQFVKENPDYFSDDIKIRFELIEASKRPYMDFYSSFGGKELDEELGLEFDHKIKYVEYDVDSYTPDALDSRISLDIPVVIMNYYWQSKTDFQDLNKLLNICSGTKYVMAYMYEKMDIDWQEFTEHVQQEVPEAKVYKMLGANSVELIN